MSSHTKQNLRGVTLIELLLCLIILAIAAMTSTPMLNQLITSQRLGANANQVLAMIHTARAEGAYRSSMLICSGKGRCDTFNQPDDQLILIADRNSNGTLDAADQLISELSFPQGMSIQWRSFRNLPSLRINRHGVAYYQNGHFLLCYRGQARKVILNFQAKARVSRDAPITHCPSANS